MVLVLRVFEVLRSKGDNQIERVCSEPGVIKIFTNCAKSSNLVESAQHVEPHLDHKCSFSHCISHLLRLQVETAPCDFVQSSSARDQPFQKKVSLEAQVAGHFKRQGVLFKFDVKCRVGKSLLLSYCLLCVSLQTTRGTWNLYLPFSRWLAFLLGYAQNVLYLMWCTELVSLRLET